MLVHDLQYDIAQWLPIWGMSATLSMMELHMANDLNNMVPSPYSKLEPVRPPCPEIVKGVAGGTESDTNSLPIDSGDEWDKTEVQVFSHCPIPIAKIGPTCAEVHAAVQEEEVIQKQESMWEDIVSKQSSGGAEEEDWDTKGSHLAAEPQFEDATIEEEE